MKGGTCQFSQAEKKDIEKLVQIEIKGNQAITNSILINECEEIMTDNFYILIFIGLKVFSLLFWQPALTASQLLFGTFFLM